MHLKSSNLKVCSQQANVVRGLRSRSRRSQGSNPFPQTWFSGSIFDGLFLKAVLPAAIALLLTNPLLSQAADSAAGITHTDLRVSTIEGPSRTQATFTASVASTNTDSAKPTGSVSFMRGNQSIGAAFLDGEGRATLTVDALPAGMQNITAVYEGDDSHLPSTSTPAATNSATSGVAGFTLSAAPTSLKIKVGAAGTTVITATPENGFNQAVSLSCSGAPYVSVTCIFSPAQVTPAAPTASAPNGKPVISTLTVQTIAPSGAQLREPGRHGGTETAYALAVPGIFALAGLGLVRKRAFTGTTRDAAKVLGVLLLLAATCVGLSGCNVLYDYNKHGPGYNPGTPVGQYTLTVSGITGTGSSLSTGSVAIALDITN